MIVTKINKVALEWKTNYHFLPCRSCSNSVKVTWRLQLRCDAVFMTSSVIAQQFSTIFSAGCYFSDNTKYNHIWAIPTTPTKSTFV